MLPKRSKAWTVAILGVLIAMQVLLGSFFSIQFLMTKITFAFIITAIMARLFPPHITAGASALSSILGMLLFPKFSFFLGFALTAGLTGWTYAQLLYQQPLKWWHIAVASALVTFGYNLFLNSLWLHWMYGLKWAVLFSTRIPQEAVSFVIYVILVQLVLKGLPLTQLIRRA